MMRALILSASLGLLLAACTDPETVGRVNATIAGFVYVTGPVAGARVAAYSWDLETGNKGELLAQSEPSSETGAFSLELGNYASPVLLVARGIGATYVEPASGTVTWDSQTELRGTFAVWDTTGALAFDVPSGEALADVIISPWTDLALSYTDGRFVSKRSRSYKDAATRALGLLRDHLEVDHFAVAPQSLNEAATSLNTTTQASLVLAGLSQLARRAALDSNLSAAGLSTLQLLELLRRDLSDSTAQLDGKDVAGALSVGNCTSVCTLSSKTLRAHFAEAMATFLGSTANQSALTVSDAADFLRRVSSRRGELWADEGSESFDTTSPTITARDLQDATILSGTKVATIDAVDNFKMGTTQVTLLRQGDPVADPGILETQVVSEGDQRRVVTLTLHTEKLSDGPVTVHVEAADDAGNEAMPLDIPVFFDNAPAARLSGIATVGGPLIGARIEVFEYDNATKGRLLGAAMTEESGMYSLMLDDTTQSVLLVRADTPPVGEAAYYIEPANGSLVRLGASHIIESILTGHRNGTDRSDGMLSPWTHVGAAYARAAYRYLGQNWPQTVDQAFAAWELHFAEGGTSIALRSVTPANLTIPEEGTTLTIQARYGLTLAALGQLADVLAKDTGATVASVNSLKLTQVLAADLGEELGAPVLNGRALGLLDINGSSVTSYLTRLQLASAAASFLRNNVNNRSALRELDVRTLLDRIATDDGARGAAWPALYPASEPPKPYDTQPPAPIDFVDPTPGAGEVLRGVLSLRGQSSDTRALASFKWIEPAGKLTAVSLDTTAGKDGVWVLSGDLNTDLFGEGDLRIVARAQDEAGLTTDGDRIFVVDRTAPSIRIDNAAQTDPVTSSTQILPDGGWTRLDTLAASGAVTDLHLDAARASWNGGTPTPLALDEQDSWSLPGLVLQEGTNTLTVEALDQAGNPASRQASYHRDTVAPVIAIAQGYAGGTFPVAADGWTKESTVKITGTLDEPNLASATYAWAPPGQTVVARALPTTSLPSWSVTVDLIEGANHFQALVTDKAGNEGRAEVQYNRDTIFPVITIDKTTAGGATVPESGWTGADTLAIQGSIVETNFVSATSRWNSGTESVLALTDGQWSISALSMVAGANTLTLVAIDQANNKTTKTVTYYRDAAAPTVSFVNSPWPDEDTITASVSGAGVGTVTYVEATRTIDLTGTGRPTITKYASRCAPVADPTTNNLPVWRMLVSDDRSIPSTVVMKARLYRVRTIFPFIGEPLTDWFVVPTLTNTNYNRQLVLSTAIHPDIALVSGTYAIDYETTDEVGNKTTGSFSWTSVLRPPPVRQNADAVCSSSAISCPSHYGLENGKYKMAVALHGGDVLQTSAGDRLRLAHGHLDNPNDVAIRVTFVETATRSYKWTTEHFPALVGNYTASATTKWPGGCLGIADRRLTGACYTWDTQVDSAASSGTDTTSAMVVYQGSTELTPCATCGVDEYEIPPKTTVQVYVEVKPFSYLALDFLVDDGENATDYGTPAITGVDTTLEWVRCTKKDASNACIAWNKYRNYHYLKSASTTYTASVGLFARPASDSETAVTGTGTNTTNYAYKAAGLATTEDTTPTLVAPLP